MGQSRPAVATYSVRGARPPAAAAARFIDVFPLAKQFALGTLARASQVARPQGAGVRVGQPCGWRNTTHLNEGEKSYLRRFRGFWTFAILRAKRISKGFECRRIEQSPFAQSLTAPNLIGSQRTICARMIGSARKISRATENRLKKSVPRLVVQTPKHFTRGKGAKGGKHCNP